MSQFQTILGRGIPQSSPYNSRQVKNDAGGFVYKVSSLDHMRRLLILGAPRVDYYVDPRKLLMKGIDSMRKAITESPVDALELIADVSKRGLGVSNDPALFALATALTIRKAAPLVHEYVPRVVRTGTHVLHFAAFVDELRGWGRAARRAVSAYYQEKPVQNLAYQLLKYRQRDGWTHRDVLRLCHAKVEGDNLKNTLLGWVTGRVKAYEMGEMFEQIAAAEDLKRITDPRVAATMIRQYRLTREMVPGGLLAFSDVWKALVPDMPLGALVRNLGNLTSKGLFYDGELLEIALRKLSDRQAIRNARLHPLSLLVAYRTYEQGHGMRGNLSWEPVESIVNALDRAFNMSFEEIEPTGKSFLIGIDVSGSMSAALQDRHNNSYPITARDAAAVMAWALWRQETKVDSLAFGDETIEFTFRHNDTLETIEQRMRNIPFGNTDCALPMLYALKHNEFYDVFAIITDNETWYGKIHPHEALRRYREKINPNAKLVVLATRMDDLSIADPEDPYQLDIAGFSPDITSAVAAFAKM